MAGGILSPAALVLSFVARHGIAVPFWDQWELVDLLARHHAGELTLADLLAQHNEHRPFFPRLAWLGLAALSRWDVRYELWGNAVLAGLTLVVLWRLLVTTVRPLDPALPIRLLLPLSWLAFSLVQAENWVWGWQLSVFLNVLASVLAVWAVTRWSNEWRGLLLASGAAVVATLSFASGLLMWSVIPFAFLGGPAARRWALRVSSAMLGVAVWVAYFANYRHPAHHPNPRFLFQHPLEYRGYVAAWLGGPLGAGRVEIALVAGSLGLLALAGAAGWLWKQGPELRRLVVPWCGLACYAVASAAMTGVGRVGFGVEQALSGRYTTIAGLFWMGLVVLGAIAVRETWVRRPPGAAGVRRLVWAAAAVAVVAAALGYGFAYQQGRAYHKARGRVVRAATGCLMAYERASAACLETLYPSAGRVRALARTLEALGLGPFAPGRRTGPPSRPAP